MEVSSESFGALKTWKKKGLRLDICEINKTFKYKKPKICEVALEDTLIEGERYGVCSKKGSFRKIMEDTYSVSLEIHNCAFKHAFAIFDGHSGTEASVFASKNLINNIDTIDEQGIVDAFQLTDYLFCSENPQRGGTTVALAVLDHTKLFTANIGDTKIILIKQNSYQVLSYDHIASDTNEKTRIEMAGGYVINRHNILRVCGQLAITRSIGDARYKDYLIPLPYFQSTNLAVDDVALVIASDGLFEVLTPYLVAEIVKEKSHHSPSEIAEVLTSEAIEGGSKDNVTVIVVKLQEFFTLAGSQTDRNKKKSFNF